MRKLLRFFKSIAGIWDVLTDGLDELRELANRGRTIWEGTLEPFLRELREALEDLRDQVGGLRDTASANSTETERLRAELARMRQEVQAVRHTQGTANQQLASLTTAARDALADPETLALARRIARTHGAPVDAELEDDVG